MKWIRAAVISGLAWASLAAAEPADSSFPTAKHLVMSWCRLAVTRCLTRLQETYDGAGMKDGLTHLGLQFWTPTMTGGLSLLDKTTNDAAIKEVREWGHAHGVRVLLCVFNGAKKWDWPLARAGFAEHPKEFADRLIAEMERLNLDGIDIDLEGNGNFEKDKPAYVQFISALSQKLHAQNKHLTADSFSYQWNAPNQTCWIDLVRLLVGLTTMGFEVTGANAGDWRAYAAQCATCDFAISACRRTRKCGRATQPRIN